MSFGVSEREIFGSRSYAMVGCNFNVKPLGPVMATDLDVFVWLLDDAVKLDAKRALILLVPPMIMLVGLVLSPTEFFLGFHLTAVFSVATISIPEA